MEKNTFLIYLDYEDQFNLLSNEELGLLLRAVMTYEKTGEIPKFEGMLKMAFSVMKTRLDRDAKKWEETKKKRSEAGKRGMASRWESNTNDITQITKDNNVIEDITQITNITDNVNDSVNVNDNVNKKEIKKKSFDNVFAAEGVSEELKKVLCDFIDMRKAIKKPMTTRALEILIDNTRKLETTEEKQIAVLNQSIEHGWQTVYPLKEISKKNEQTAKLIDKVWGNGYG